MKIPSMHFPCRSFNAQLSLHAETNANHKCYNLLLYRFLYFKRYYFTHSRVSRDSKHYCKPDLPHVQSAAELADPATDVFPSGQAEQDWVVPPALYSPTGQSIQSPLVFSSFCPDPQGTVNGLNHCPFRSKILQIWRGLILSTHRIL